MHWSGVKGVHGWWRPALTQTVRDGGAQQYTHRVTVVAQVLP